MNINFFQNHVPIFTARKKFIAKQQLEECIAQSKTNREIASEYGVATVTVRQTRRKYGLPPERIPFPKSEIKKLVEEGKTDRQISEITGLSYQYTGVLRRKLDLKPQSPSPAKSTIEELFKKGYKHKKVAEMLGISTTWLTALKIKYGLPLTQRIVDVKWITELINSNYPDKDISEITGTGIRTIGDIRRGLGKKNPTKKCKPLEIVAQEINEVTELRSQGKKPKEIAQILGKSLCWVYKRLKR